MAEQLRYLAPLPEFYASGLGLAIGKAWIDLDRNTDSVLQRIWMRMPVEFGVGRDASWRLTGKLIQVTNSLPK